LDIETDCPTWAADGECVRNPRYMSSRCERSCGLCHFRTGAEPSTAGTSGGGGNQQGGGGAIQMIGVEAATALPEVAPDAPLRRERTMVRCDFGFIDIGAGDGATLASLTPFYR